MDGEIVGVVIGSDLNVDIAAVLGIDIGTGGYTPSGEVGANLAPNLAGKGRKVGGRGGRRLNTILEVDVSRLGSIGPGDGGVESIKTLEASVTDRDLQKPTYDGCEKMLAFPEHHRCT